MSQPDTEAAADYLIPIGAVATLLDFHPETVRRMCIAGQLPAIRVGRSWRIRKSVVDQILAEGTS